MNSEVSGERVRFGRFAKGRRRGVKNSVLVTLKSGDEIYFGISKCHKKLDTWDREEGLRYARQRLNAALSMTAAERANTLKPDWKTPVDSLVIHKDGTLGRCHVKDVKKLLAYFNEVALFLPKNPKKCREEQTAEVAVG